MFVGEGPGLQEDRLGRPFVGSAGMFLNELLESVGLRRPDVFITNLVKCRPPNNRDPLPNEIESCNNHLKDQIRIIKPQVVIPLGRHAMSHWFPSGRIGELHGRPHRVGGLIILPLYHPAAALHNGSLRETIMQDFQILRRFLRDSDVSIREQKEQNLPETKQLNL
jgi:DNA polymerase